MKAADEAAFAAEFPPSSHPELWRWLLVDTGRGITQCQTPVQRARLPKLSNAESGAATPARPVDLGRCEVATERA